MSKLLQQYQSFKQNPSSGAFSFLIAAKKELYDEMTRVAEQAGEKFVKTVIEKARRNAEKEFESYKEITLKAMEKELNTLNELAYEIKTNTMKGDKGEDGKDADEEKIFKKLMGKMPIVKDGKDADEERITREILKKTKKEIQNEIMNFFLRNPKKK